MGHTELERVVDEQWAAVLQLEPGAMASTEDFFSAGGDSLAAVELLERLNQELGVEVPPEVMFFDGTKAGILAACNELLGEAT